MDTDTDTNRNKDARHGMREKVRPDTTRTWENYKYRYKYKFFYY